MEYNKINSKSIFEPWDVSIAEDSDNMVNVINSEGQFIASASDYDYAVIISCVPELVKIARKVIGTCSHCIGHPMVHNHSDWCIDARRIVKIVDELFINKHKQ